ncbi:sensor histidine kinase [Roseivirga seohaensis]|uniref:sensor histidine kinase n=1 Tax=Roseivirga seohaensis TaxID=1914963 RepID=UPI003BABAEF2
MKWSRRTALGLFLFLMVSEVQAQVNYLDSILTNLEKEIDLTDTSSLIQHLNELSVSILYDAKDSVRAKELVQRTLVLSFEKKDTVNIISSLGYMANILGFSGWPEKSIEKSKEVLSYPINQSDSIAQSHAYAYNNIGIIYARFLKNYDSAIFFLNKGEELANKIDKVGIARASGLWKAYVITRLKKPELLDSAILMARAARDAESTNLVSRLTAAEVLIYALALKSNDLDFYRDVQKWKEMVNLNNDSFQSALREADAKYEVRFKDSQLKLKEQEVALHEAGLKRQKLVSYFLVAFVVITLGVSWYFRRLLLKNKKLAQRNELLVREQNHRVKNNLQMISSLLSLQAGKAQDEVSKDALKQSQGRIQAIALLNRSLYDQEEIGDIDLKVYISELITEVINSITDTEVKYQLDIDNIKLDLEKTTSLGLIINELIVNSVKYVKQSVTEFSLSIKAQSGKFSLEYADNGENFDLQAYQNSKSFGKKLVDLQAKQLKGKSKISNDSQFRYQLNFS